MGTPWEAQEGAKLEQNRNLESFLKLKRRSYKKWSWNAFLFVLGTPGRSKNWYFASERLQKTAFQDVAFQHRLETSLGEIWEAKLGLSWSQVGLYKGSKWHVKVTSKSSCGIGTGMGEAPCGDMGKLHFGIKNAIFPLFFEGFAKWCLCARNEEVT